MKIIFIYTCVRYEFNRPYLQHKELQTDDALAVEATSYALLTLFLVEVIHTRYIFLSSATIFVRIHKYFCAGIHFNFGVCMFRASV